VDFPDQAQPPSGQDKNQNIATENEMEGAWNSILEEVMTAEPDHAPNRLGDDESLVASG